MAEEKIPSPELEIAAPPPSAPPRPARPDPGVIDGEAAEIRDKTVAESAANPAEDSASPPPDEPARSRYIAPYVAPAAIGLGGALIGAALALLAAWLIDPRAAALEDVRARLATLETSVDGQAAMAVALDKRVATLETSAGGAARAGALDALGRRVGALEAASGDARIALDEARAARADAARSLAAAQAGSSSSSPAASTDADADTGALAPRIAKLAADLAAANARLDKLSGLDDRLARLEGASAAPKSDARVTSAGGAADKAASVAVLALSLEQRFGAGQPYAAELGALSQLGIGADALAPLKPLAESGAPTPAALAAAWAKVEAAVDAAAAPIGRSGWDRLLDHMRALVRVRRVGETPGGDESAPPAARIGAALARGDVGAALDLFDKLPEASRAAGQSWLEMAKARVAAAKAAAALRAEAIGRLATAKD